MKVLIVKLSSLGDIIHSLPVLTTLKAKFPNWQISWLVSERFAEILENHSAITKLYKLPKQFWEIVQLVKELKAENFDLVLDLQGLMKSALISKMILPKRIVGVSPAREKFAELLWTEKINSSKILDPDKHVIERSLEVLESLEIVNEDFLLQAPEAFSLNVSAELPSELKNSEFILCAPETRWESKHWPANYWQELIQGLAAKSSNKIVLVGTQKDFVLEDENLQVIDLRGQTNLQEILALTKNAKLVIGLDSAVLHIAAAFGTKTLGLFGPTSPRRSGPWQGNYLHLELECSPCHKRQCLLIKEKHMLCLNNLLPDIVLQKVEELLQ
jgi:heptosyltransferase-1